MDIKIRPVDRIYGEIDVPGDKSISHRTVILGALSKGSTIAENFLTGEDCVHTAEAFKKMGVAVDIDDRTISIKGEGLKGLKKPDGPIYLGNSGTSMRVISGVLAGQDFDVVLTGDESLSKRPMKRIVDPLKQMNADIRSLSGEDGYPPIAIQGRTLKPINYVSKIASAQVKSCILFAGLYANGVTEVREPYQSRDHTERMLKHFGANIKRNNLRTSIDPCQNTDLRGKKIVIPGDISSAAFFIVAALITDGSKLIIRGVGNNPTRNNVIQILKRMGADITVYNEKNTFEPYCDMIIKASALKATTVHEHEVPNIIDEIPVLCVASAQAEGRTVIKGIKELRVKETDRVYSMTENLKKIGVNISSTENEIIIDGVKGRFEGGEFESFGDHRTAMAMSCASVYSKKEGTVKDIECVNTSFPNFYELLDYVSA